MITKEQLVRYIDHSLLKPNLTNEDIINGCLYAKDLNCVSVCVNSNRVKMAYDVLKDTQTAVGTVVGFPSGAHTTYIKALETEEAYKNGATEIDMVIDIGAIRSGDIDYVRNDISEVVKSSPAIVKVILETAYLTDEEIILGSKLCEEAGAHYVKTSTGFAHEGATIKNILLMKNAVSDKMKIKAAGGITDLKFSLELIEAGCTRLGTSKTTQILAELDK
ncbi:deoxyribose-phosphate aldolase [Alkalibacter saccharofermentans]|uniref:Deoxyribose-phosphate aldolase n=1 Tax=Alkalibacter saccharofermentans DSM 14828 TaxID=1120975 RepID=A0A1M4SEL4_9FIRM|nr:deoxyribose-phosphate aldolase [Alkalibacter saccharofermentans]SHE30602.1 deoxyribose-phosphate aldolase [Alkalibacter saccharofermentans DSM 14828]